MRKFFKLIIVTFLISFISIFIAAFIPHRHNDQVLYVKKRCRPEIGEVSYFPLIYKHILRLRKIRYGIYKIKQNCSFVEIARTIWSGNQIMEKIYIPDGSSNKQIFKILDNNSSLTGIINNDIKEGELMCGTYCVSHGESRQNVIRLMYSEAKKTRHEIKSIYKKTFLTDDNQWITIASILEKEGKDYNDKKLIASVILNRIRKNMRLEIDATAIYVKTDGTYSDKLKWNDVLKRKFVNGADYKSPYNTYVHKGLTPGPITNPSRESLEVAFNSLPGEHLFYRLVNDKHVFFKTFQEHKKALSKK